MRSVNELAGLGFNFDGESYVRAAESETLLHGRDPFEFQAYVWADSSGTVWDRLYVYISHADSDKNPWFGFNLQGESTDRGGDLEGLVNDVQADLEDEEGLTTEDITMMQAQTYADVKKTAEAAARRILGV
jgi:hypothetical protein